MADRMLALFFSSVSSRDQVEAESIENEDGGPETSPEKSE